VPRCVTCSRLPPDNLTFRLSYHGDVSLCDGLQAANGGGEQVTLPQFTNFWTWYSAIYKLITDPRVSVSASLCLLDWLSGLTLARLRQ
jgi:hypothetical protein